jgi:hypothetical protein
MNAPERARSYLQVDGDSIRATTAVEFRQLLDRFRALAGLTPSQIAIKTTIPRSQAYNMVAANRTTLPSKPGQVREFVEACGLGPVEVALVMDLWIRLDQQARDRAATRAVPPALADRASGSFRHGTFVNSFYNPDIVVDPDRQFSTRPRRRSRGGSDLLFMILESDQRTRRALLLLLPVTMAIVAIVASFVTWAILQPEHASMIAATLAAGFLLPITSMMRQSLKSRR